MVTVKQLRKMLETMPDDMPVVVRCDLDGGGYDALDSDPEIIKVSDTLHGGSYSGRYCNPAELNEEARDKYKQMNVVLIS